MPVFYYKGKKMSTTSQDSDLQGYGKAVRDELGKRVSRKKKLKVLDVGTGFGINVLFLARWLKSGSEVWTVDPSKDTLENAEAMIAREKVRPNAVVNYAVASADDLRFSSGFFDVVVCVMVLHHLERIQPALGEMSRVLKDGGTMLVVDFLPKASHELDFHTRHDLDDFYKPSTVIKAIAKTGMEASPTTFDMWYLVEAKKPTPRGAAGA